MHNRILRGFHFLVKNTSFLTRAGQLITLCTANMPLALQSRGNMMCMHKIYCTSCVTTNTRESVEQIITSLSAEYSSVQVEEFEEGV